MNIDLLIKMANEIGDFFTGASPPEQAAKDVATHLRRYWEPRMRKQMLDYFEQRHGAGLSDVAKEAVGLLAAAAKAPPGGTPSASASPVTGAKA
ncbi:MAG TPA: formate dehydrogenase subunit delta [Steroidobacteraceae bacterium]|nr:formate dehydrogenase subunit delta [Steroidobacteraceae bacterium]